MQQAFKRVKSASGMIRSENRRRYFFENMILEQRQVLALPTNLEQELLALVNRFRADPEGEFDRYISSTNPVQSPIPGVAGAVAAFGVNLTVLKSELAALMPQPPLAWNTSLNDAAYGHSQLMITKDSQAHVLPGENDIGTRIVNAGYTNWNTYGENIFAYATSVAYAQAGFVIDWGSGTDGMQSPRGHRNNLINGSFKELGISIVEENNPSTQVGPLVVTQDFGNCFNRTNSSVLGEIFTDTNSDHFYNAGEGNSGVTLTLNGAGGTFTTTSWASGGYQFDNVPAGTYSLSIAGPGISTSYWTRSITVGANNIGSDFDLSQQPKSTVGFDSAIETQVKEGNSVVITLTRQGAISDALDVTVTPKDLASSTEIWQNLIQPIAKNGVVHFDPNQATATFTLQSIADKVIRADTHLNLQLTINSNKYIAGIAAKPLFVLNDDGSVGFDSSADVTLNEGGQSVLTIRRIGTTIDPLDVTVTPQDLAGSTEIWQNLIQPLANNGVVHFDAGQSVATITINAISDNVICADTRLNLKLTSVSNIFIAVIDTVPITVFNDDGTVGFDNNTELPLREGGQLPLTIVRSGALTFPVDVKISPVNLGSGETWQNLIQPLSNNGMVHFNAGQTQATIDVTALQDNLVKPDSRVTLQLTSISTAILASVDQKPLLVQNNNGVVGFDNAIELALNEGGQLQLNLVRTGAMADAIDVTVKPVDFLNAAVTWQNLVQVLPNNGVVHFAAGQAQATVAITAIQDTIVRPDVHLNFQVTTSAPNWAVSATNLKSLLILNDDTAIAFQDSTEIQLKEGAQVAVNITRSGNITNPLNVDVSPSDLPGVSQNWQNLILPVQNNGVLHFDAGQAVATFMLTAIQDDIFRPDTRLNLVLSTSDTSVKITAATRSVLVLNDDVDKPGTFQFATSSLNAQVSEGAGKASLKITRTGGSLGQVVIPWTITLMSGPKLITVKPVDISFAAGQTTASIDIPLVNDKLAQLDQVFSVVLGTPKTAGALLGTAKTATLTVLEDDPKPVFSSLAGKRTKLQLTSLNALFTDKLNATTAKLTSVWKVTEAGVDGLFGTADDVLVAIKNAAYNATAKKIILTFATASKNAKPLNYQVTLNGSGLQNVYNVPLGSVTTRTIKV